MLDFTALALHVATEGHKGVNRNDNKTPYITHPVAVRKIALDMIPLFEAKFNVHLVREWVEQVAYMHDLVEDVPNITIDVIRGYGFNPLVVDGVAAITKHPVKGVESYLDYLRRVQANHYSWIVKLADLVHNMSDLKPGNMKDKYVLATYILNYCKI